MDAGTICSRNIHIRPDSFKQKKGKDKQTGCTNSHDTTKKMQPLAIQQQQQHQSNTKTDRGIKPHTFQQAVSTRFFFLGGSKHNNGLSSMLTITVDFAVVVVLAAGGGCGRDSAADVLAARLAISSIVNKRSVPSFMTAL